MTQLQSITTAESLFAAGDIGRCELVRGEVIPLSLPGFQHGLLVSRISGLLGEYAEAQKLGVVICGDPGFILERNPDTVRAPDVAFISTQRAPEPDSAGFLEGPPDLAVEVNSPSDRASEVSVKIAEYFAAGCRMVWVVDPPSKTVTVYTPDHRATVLGMTDHLTGGEVVPGFEVAIAKIFGR